MLFKYLISMVTKSFKNRQVVIMVRLVKIVYLR